MALINCEECGKEVSDKAKTCPNCGAPIEVEKPFFEGFYPRELLEQKEPVMSTWTKVLCYITSIAGFFIYFGYVIPICWGVCLSVYLSSKDKEKYDIEPCISLRNQCFIIAAILIIINIIGININIAKIL